MRAREYEAYKHKILAEAGGDKATVESLCDVIFGKDQYDDPKYIVRYRWNPYEESTPLNRFNMLWVWPLFVVFVAPVMYIKHGHTGVRKETKLGQILVKLIGEY